jgi:hypothetical protein
MSNIFLTLSIVVGLFSSVIGVYSIFKGEFKPHRITRLILLINISIIFFSLLLLGDITAVWLSGVQLLLGLIIFVLSFKYGVGGQSKSDFLILFLAFVIIIIWQTSNDSLLALNLSILLDLVGFIPPIYKCFVKPYSEDPKFYLSDTIAGLFSFLALTTFSWNSAVFPIYVFLINFICFGLIIIGRRFSSKNHLTQKDI